MRIQSKSLDSVHQYFLEPVQHTVAASASRILMVSRGLKIGFYLIEWKHIWLKSIN